jgi:hypothetical protein
MITNAANDAFSLIPGCVACNATHLAELTSIPRGDDAGRVDAADLTKLDDNSLDRLIAAKAGEIGRHRSDAAIHRQAERTSWRDLMPLLEEKRQRLTRRGKKSDKNFTSFLTSMGLEPPTVRSWRLRLKQEQASSATESVGPGEESSETLGNCESQGERVEIQTGAELLAEFISQMAHMLSRKSMMTNDERIKRAIEMLGDLQRALDEGKLFPTR